MSHIYARRSSKNNVRSRYTLNIKGIPYKTIWVEFPDVKALCQKIGAAPTLPLPDGTMMYTLPTIYDPNTKTAVSDSAAIARYLDRAYPHAGLTLVPPEVDAFLAPLDVALTATTLGGGHLPPVTVPAMCALLNARSAAYFRRTREAFFGPLDALAPAGSEKRAEHWRGAQKTMSTLASWLGSMPDGTERLFFLGSRERICFADLVFAGLMKGLEKAFTPEEFTEVMAWDDGRWARFMEAFRPYEDADAGSLVEL